jgi:hypothetical protein
MFPARVIDPQMRIFVPDFPFDKAAHNKPQDGGNYSLVILFDIIGTW